jgi:O-antigen/teichoic acid export membrane protein
MKRNVLYYTLGNFIPKAVGFILVPLYTRSLGPTEFGMLSTLLSLQAIIIIFMTFGIERSLYRLVHDQSVEFRGEYFATTAFFIFLVSIINAIIILCFFSVFSHYLFPDIPFYPYYPLLILSVFLGTFSLVPSISFMINEQGRKFFIFNLLQFAMTTVFTIFFVLIYDLKTEGALLALFVANALFMPIGIFCTYHGNKIRFTKIWNIVKPGIKYVLPLLPAFLSAWVINLSDRLIMNMYYPLSEVGVFSLASKVSFVIIAVAGALFSAYNPIFFKEAAKNSRIVSNSILIRYHNNIHKLLLFLSGGLILCLPQLINILGDDRYVGAERIALLLIIGTIFSQLTGLYNLSVYQMKKTKAIAIVMVLSSCVNLALNFVFVPTFGGEGAAITSLLTFVLVYIVMFFIAKRYYYIPVDWVGLFPFVIWIIFVIILNNVFIVPFVYKILYVLIFSSLFFRKEFLQIFNYNKMA